MDTAYLHATLGRQFAKLGAQLEVEVVEPRWNRWRKDWLSPLGNDFTLDIVDEGSRTERFLLRVDEQQVNKIEFVTADVRPNLRHLLLLSRTETQFDKFLCGHDERH